MRVLIPFYSMYGHVHQLAKAAAEGVAEAGGEAVLRRVPETLPREVLERMRAIDTQRQWADVPVCQITELADADGIFFGTPTRFGNMCGQMKQFLDATGALWAKGALAGKPGGVFTSSATQHGGQESTILSMHIVLLHHGMVVVGLPYSFRGQAGVEEVKGGSPYGASTIAGSDGARQPSEADLAGARFHGRHLAEIAARLKR